MNVDWNIYVFIKVETNHPLPAKTELSSHRIKILIFYTESGWYIIFLETIYNILIGCFFFGHVPRKLHPQFFIRGSSWYTVLKWRSLTDRQTNNSNPQNNWDLPVVHSKGVGTSLACIISTPSSLTQGKILWVFPKIKDFWNASDKPLQNLNNELFAFK